MSKKKLLLVEDDKALAELLIWLALQPQCDGSVTRLFHFCDSGGAANRRSETIQPRACHLGVNSRA